MVEKNSETQNEMNKRIRKATQFYHLINSILWNKDTESVNPQYVRCTLRRYHYMEWRHGLALRDRKAK
jgi:hypothetical protein